MIIMGLTEVRLRGHNQEKWIMQFLRSRTTTATLLEMKIEKSLIFTNNLIFVPKCRLQKFEFWSKVEDFKWTSGIRKIPNSLDT